MRGAVEALLCGHHHARADQRTSAGPGVVAGHTDLQLDREAQSGDPATGRMRDGTAGCGEQENRGAADEKPARAADETDTTNQLPLMNRTLMLTGRPPDLEAG